MAPVRASRHLALLTLVLSMVGLGWLALGRIERQPVLARAAPEGVMGTVCSLIAVLPSGEGHRAAAVLAAAEGELRRLEAVLSTWIDASEVSALQRAPVGEEVALSPDLREVLARALRIHHRTAGAFDVTAAPLISGWRSAASGGRLPGAAELAELRAASTWQDLELTATGAIKLRASLRLDIDGIAKGYAIDQALEAMRRAGAVGGMVEVGGDLRVFGRTPDERGWRVGIRRPSAGAGVSVLGDLAVEDAAVCTSGGYARFVEIEGERFSHILDPRTGAPVEEVASVTVIAPEAATADAWATALSVLGEAGLADLEEGVEALLVFDREAGARIVASPGFPELAPAPDRG